MKYYVAVKKKQGDFYIWNSEKYSKENKKQGTANVLWHVNI